MDGFALTLTLALLLALASGVLALLVASDRLTWRQALGWGVGLLVAVGGLGALFGRPRPAPPPRAPLEPDRRLVERITGEVLVEREAAREERVTLEADPAAPVAGRLSGAVGATRRRRP